MPKSWGRYLALVFLVAGVATATILVGQRQNIFSQAWSGVIVQLDGLTSTNPPALASLPHSTASQILFYRLTRLYPDAEKQDIDLPSADIHGQAFLARDTTGPVPKTFIFIRLANLAAPTGRLLQLWLVNSRAHIFSRASTFETVSSPAGPTSFAVAVREGDLSQFDTVSLSLDLAPGVIRPTLPLIDLRL